MDWCRPPSSPRHAAAAAQARRRQLKPNLSPPRLELPSPQRLKNPSQPTAAATRAPLSRSSRHLLRTSKGATIRSPRCRSATTASAMSFTRPLESLVSTSCGYTRAASKAKKGWVLAHGVPGGRRLRSFVYLPFPSPNNECSFGSGIPFKQNIKLLFEPRQTTCRTVWDPVGERFDSHWYYSCRFSRCASMPPLLVATQTAAASVVLTLPLSVASDQYVSQVYWWLSFITDENSFGAGENYCVSGQSSESYHPTEVTSWYCEYASLVGVSNFEACRPFRPFLPAGSAGKHASTLCSRTAAFRDQYLCRRDRLLPSAVLRAK